MHRLLLLTLLFALFSLPASATTYYAKAACASGNMSTCGWNTTAGTSCNASGGTDLTWANRVAGDTLVANGCAGIVIDTDPGIGGAALNLNNSGGTAGGQFTCSAATGPATVNANVTAGSSTTATVALSGSGANCAFGTVSSIVLLSGGSAASASAVADTHTTGTIVHYASAVGGSSSSSALGYSFISASGSVTLINAKGGSAGQGLSVAGTGGTATVKNCVGSDTANGIVGCISTPGNNASVITITGSIVAGKYAGGISNGKFYFAPTDATSAVYFAVNSTYTSGDIVDANYNVKGSPTLTNAYVAPLAFATTGIGNAAKVVTGTTYGPYTGTAPNSSNSGSAH